jgi:tRNA pseudouridine55 synthase
MSDFHGYLNVYKEKGMTSHDVVFKVRKILGTKKIGHTGTLDPDAEGVLVLCIGKATKMVEYIVEHDKIYEAEIIFGMETDTCDLSGKVLSEEKSRIKKPDLLKILSQFTGKIRQQPPIYSAIRVNGKKLYHYARSGETVEIPFRTVSISKIELLEFSETKQKAKIMVSCSKGTYIRSLCRDIGRVLENYGCMGNLVRHGVGEFISKHGLKLAEIQEHVDNETLQKHLYPLEFSLDRYRCVSANEQGRKFLINGNKLYQWNAIQSFDDYLPSEILRMYDGDRLVGMGTFIESDENAYIKPSKLL